MGNTIHNKLVNAKKQRNGVTLITVVVAVVILLTISSMLIYNARNGIKMRNLQWMQNDIELLDDKVDSYYVKYGALPISKQYTNEISFIPQINDKQEYYVIDLEALEDGVTLNYGQDYHRITNTTTENEMKSYKDIYIIDVQSHHIYYVKGIELDGEMYYTTTEDEGINIVEIPKEVQVTLSQQPENGTWASEVVLTGYAKTNDPNDKIAEYCFCTNPEDTDNLNWQYVSRKTEIQKKITVTDNETYYFMIKTNSGAVYESEAINVSNIEKIH